MIHLLLLSLFPLSYVFGLQHGSYVQAYTPRQSGSKAKEDFRISTSGLPKAFADVIDATGPLYSGMLPIDDNEPDRALFFYYAPHPSSDDVVIWSNGGPGCSSLNAAFMENGPWLVKTNGTEFVPYVYEHAWSKFANVLFYENPVGTGFSYGSEDRISDMDGWADEFEGWFRHWLEVFPEAKSKKLYFVGESFGSFYAFRGAERLLDMGLIVGGFAIIDGVLPPDEWREVSYLSFILRQKELLGLDDLFIERFTKEMALKGIGPDLYDKLLTYPQTPGPIFLPESWQWISSEPDPYSRVVNEVEKNNDCFNIYRISDICPE